MKDILIAQYSAGMWHIRSAYNPEEWPYWTARNETDMFNFLRKRGYELLTLNNGTFYFKEV